MRHLCVVRVSGQVFLRARRDSLKKRPIPHGKFALVQCVFATIVRGGCTGDSGKCVCRWERKKRR